MKPGEVWIYRSPWGPVRATIQQAAKDGSGALVRYKVPEDLESGPVVTEEAHADRHELTPTRGVES